MLGWAPAPVNRAHMRGRVPTGLSSADARRTLDASLPWAALALGLIEREHAATRFALTDQGRAVLAE
jgi:hypothetical protein